MKFHHIGIATKDLKSSLEFVQKNFEVLEVSEEIFDENQNATLQMIKTKDLNIELVSGKVVEKLIASKITAAGSLFPGESLSCAITVTLLRLPHSTNCSRAAARKVSAAASMIS